jgi:class 3 adenylate cyclase
VECRRVILVADLAGFSRAVGPLSTVEVADLVHRFYAAAAALVESRGGRVVKFVGDGCLAVLPEDAAPVYRKLPNDQRRGWRKHQPPATYLREGAV